MLQVTDSFAVAVPIAVWFSAAENDEEDVTVGAVESSTPCSKVEEEGLVTESVPGPPLKYEFSAKLPTVSFPGPPQKSDSQELVTVSFPAPPKK